MRQRPRLARAGALLCAIGIASPAALGSGYEARGGPERSEVGECVRIADVVLRDHVVRIHVDFVDPRDWSARRLAWASFERDFIGPLAARLKGFAVKGGWIPEGDARDREKGEVRSGRLVLHGPISLHKMRELSCTLSKALDAPHVDTTGRRVQARVRDLGYGPGGN